MQRLLAPLGAATAVIAVVAVSAALVSGGSTRKGSTAHRQRPKTGITANRTANDAAMIRAGVIGLFLPATGTQYTTGSLFHGQIDALESDATATCMARSGFQSRPITAANAVAAYGYYDLSQFPDLGLISRTGELSRNYFYNPGLRTGPRRTPGPIKGAATRP
jgi:hypothetical protein